jgi:AcrR family transcriptional regulator
MWDVKSGAGVKKMDDVTTSPSRTYAGSTQQQRQERRRAALMDAALDLLVEGGVERVSAIGACKKARLNQRYFSESFTDPDELLAAALDRTAAEVWQYVLATIETHGDLDTTARMTKLAEAAVEFLTADPRHRVLLTESQASARFRARRAEWVQLLATLIADQIRQALDGEVPSEIMLRLTAHTLTSGVLDTVTAWLRGELDVPRDILIKFLAELPTASVGVITVNDAPPRMRT